MFLLQSIAYYFMRFDNTNLKSKVAYYYYSSARRKSHSSLIKMIKVQCYYFK